MKTNLSFDDIAKEIIKNEKYLKIKIKKGRACVLI